MGDKLAKIKWQLQHGMRPTKRHLKFFFNKKHQSLPEEVKEEEKVEEEKELAAEVIVEQVYQRIHCPELKYFFKEGIGTKTNYTFGEVLPEGVDKLLQPDYLDASTATNLYELGLGFGRFALQAMLQWPNLKSVIGTELHPVRARSCFSALQRFALMNADHCKIACSVSGHEPTDFKTPGPHSPKDFRIASVSVRFDATGRCINFRKQDLFELLPEATAQADIIIAAVAFSRATRTAFCEAICKMKTGARLLSYECLQDLFRRTRRRRRMPFVQIAPSDTFPTSWNPSGHAFYLYRKI